MTWLAPRLTGFPVPARAEEYERAAAELETKLHELPGIVAVYRTGAVAVPGISDLDRVAVVDGYRALPNFWGELRPRTRYLAMHTPFAVDLETFVQHRLFASLQPLEVVWGRQVAVDETSASDESDLLLAAEGLVVALLKLIKQATTGRTKVRPFLCELNNVRRNLHLARVTPDDSVSAWQLASDVTHAREKWWSLTETERVEAIRGIQARAPIAIQDALEVVASRLLPKSSGEEIRLSGSWSSVTLYEDAHGVREDSFSIVPRALAGASAKLAEARWHSARHRIGVPSPVVSLLNGVFGPGSFHERRRDVVRRYVEFMRGKAHAYSSLGHAGSFPG